MHWISFSGSDSEQADARAAEDTIAYIDRSQAKPWFIGLGFLRPHVPHVAPTRFFDMYPLGRMTPSTIPWMIVTTYRRQARSRSQAAAMTWA